MRQKERFVLAVPVDTRIHADAYDAVGFFGVPVPFPAEAGAGEPIERVLRRTDGRLDRVLAKGAMFSDVLSTLARQGLHRANAPLVEVYFNYVRSAAGRLAHLDVLPAGTGYSDLDLMITMTPTRAGSGSTTTSTSWTRRPLSNWGGVPAAARGGGGRSDGGGPFDAGYGGRGDADGPFDVGYGGGGARGGARGHAPLSAPVARPRRHLRPRESALLCEAAVEEGAWDGGLTVAEAPYHQVLAALRDPSGVFADPTAAVGVALLRAADLERFGPVDDALLGELRTAFPAALRAVSERTRKPLIVGFLPSAHAGTASHGGSARSPTNWPRCPASRCSAPTSGPDATPSRNPSTSGPSASPTSPSPRTSRRRWRCASPTSYVRYGAPRPR